MSPEILIKSGKIYLTKIEISNIANIRSVPYVCFIEVHNDITVEDHLRQCRTNKLLDDLIGEDNFNMVDERKGFIIFPHFYSTDWIKYYRLMFEFKLNLSAVSLHLPVDCLHLTNKKGLVINGQFRLFKNVYYRDNTLYYEMYYTFIQKPSHEFEWIHPLKNF
jgi:hypothetical protein